ncbi:MAG: hypothetical protein IJ088_00175 [Clostridia bacterium]|nr:hypothetical protein [Clostridia bacterium]
MKNVKYILVSLLLVICLLGTCLSASAEAPQYKKMKIAWATNQISEAFIKMQNFLNTELGPKLNIEFMYSEALSDAGALTSFIENAYINGCNGIVVDLANFIDQGAPVANDFGMFYVGISSADAKENFDVPSYIAVTGASAAGYGNSYAKAIQAAVADGAEHSIMILSGAAPYGATSFIEGTAGSLRALQDVYGLTYDKDINEMATSATQVEATNDKGVKITVVPGMGDLTATVSPLLQTGEYDVVVGTTDIYSNLSVSVSEVEKATGKNIRFISRNVFSDTISSAMNGSDSTGNPVVDAIVCQGTYEHIASVLLLRNAFDGFVDKMRAEGRCSRVSGQDPLVIVSAEEYNALSGENMPYSFVPMEDIIAMTSVVNPDVTWKTISDYGASLTTEAIIEKLVK